VDLLLLDAQIFHAVNGLAGDWEALDALMRFLPRPGNYSVAGVFAAGVWLWRERRRAVLAALVLALLIGAVDLVGGGVKSVVARPRPCRVLADVKQVVGCGRATSFPSNHAVNTAAAGAFLQTLYPQAGYVIWPFVALMGFNRVYVGSHYPSDVLGGWLLGGLSGWVVGRVLRKRWPAKPAPVSEA
jgi:undecaprenyl-diphosphatase